MPKKDPLDAWLRTLPRELRRREVGVVWSVSGNGRVAHRRELSTLGASAITTLSLARSAVRTETARRQAAGRCIARARRALVGEPWPKGTGWPAGVWPEEQRVSVVVEELDRLADGLHPRRTPKTSVEIAQVAREELVALLTEHGGLEQDRADRLALKGISAAGLSLTIGRPRKLPSSEKAKLAALILDAHRAGPPLPEAKASKLAALLVDNGYRLSVPNRRELVKRLMDPRSKARAIAERVIAWRSGLSLHTIRKRP